MKVNTAEELKAAFEEWRSQKKHPREAIPEDLLERTRRAIDVHGWSAVRKATKVEARRAGIERAGNLGQKRRVRKVAVPSFSRVELGMAATASRPFAEVETRAGLKVRLFASDMETLGLLSALCGVGGGR
jgi:hypothetical protein